MTTATSLTASEKYKEGLLDPRWKKLRTVVLERDGFSCRCCGNSSDLHVHHRQYHRDKMTGEWRKPWEYDKKYLVTLCDTCHREGHKQYTIPVMEV